MKLEELKTIFVDIDGTILFNHGLPNQQTQQPAIVLEGVLEAIADWNIKGYQIILVTGRRESERPATIKQLESAGIVYDMLIMGITRGQRILINDLKSDSNAPTAIAICVERNKGLVDIKI